MDSRWQEVFDGARSCARHFRGAEEILREGDFDESRPEGYRNLMAFMHAMQAGHSSLEDALLRVFAIIGEEAPVGRDWHAKVITRAARETPSRPAILPAGLAAAAHETRSFRHRAVHAYDVPFSQARAQLALDAAVIVAEQVEAAFERFAQSIDPD